MDSGRQKLQAKLLNSISTGLNYIILLCTHYLMQFCYLILYYCSVCSRVPHPTASCF